MPRKLVGFMLIIVFGYMAASFTVKAKQADPDEITIENKETGYIVLLRDEADLFSEEEEENLIDVMQEITEYGNVACITINKEPFAVSGAGITASTFYDQYFGNESGMIFLIDMEAREIYIECGGKIYKTITRKYAYTITDNVYRYASNRMYADCAENAFQQAYALLEGNRIAEPMKYICNALLAVISALLLNFAVVNCFSKIRKTSNKELIKHTENELNYSVVIPDGVLKSQKIYSPISSGGGGGGGGGGHSGSGGHGGGGGGRHGGGGHRF